MEMCRLLWRAQEAPSSSPQEREAVSNMLSYRIPTISESREAAINQGAPYPFCVHGRTPLHGAAFFGFPQICAELLAHPLFLSGSSADVVAYCRESMVAPRNVPLSYDQVVTGEQLVSRLQL